MVSGEGKMLDAHRSVLNEGHFSIALDSVAIFETNQVYTSPSILSMAVVTGASAGLTAFCIINPKACFGSCPTFYVSDGKNPILQAEGFSSSIAPALEASDIDALYRAQPAEKTFQITMKNEALETHVVRYVDLLAVPRPQGGRVFATPDGEFWQARELIGPVHCQGPEGDCMKQLCSFDGFERKSQTDSSFLGAKEEVELDFENLPRGKLGLVIASRQSLLSTYLFYQGLAYLGNSVGDQLAQLARGDTLTRKRIGSIGQVLGGIEILQENMSGDWVSMTEINETGPLATDVKVVPLPTLGPGSHKIKLRLAKGYWRLDYAAVAVLETKVIPKRLQPSMVFRNSNPDQTATDILLDSSRVLVTLPGDAYTLTYILPDDYSNYELFLKSKGYYMEWMRDEWLAEENRGQAAMMFTNPRKALRQLAHKFKETEADMEELFWRSRYAH